MGEETAGDELELILNAVGDLVVRRGADGRITYVNDAFRRAYGGTAEDWVGRWFMFGFGEHEGALGGRRRSENLTETVAGPMWIEWEETRMADGGVVAVGRDVSARRADEEAARGAQAAAEEMGRAKETLFAAVTHELRTPLNGVLGMADLLAKTELTPEQQSYVGTMRTSGRHLLTLVDDVLDAAKLESGAFRLTVGETDLSALVQEVAELVAPRAREKGLDVAVFIDPRTPALVRADAARLRQILLNLAGNAVKFTETGGVLLTLEREDAGGSEASFAFAVHDTGPGVPAADRQRIFEAFAQSDSSPARRAEGAGLGLAIVTRLTTAMGGQLGLDERAGGGSVFWVRASFDEIEPAPTPADLSDVQVLIGAEREIVRMGLSRQLSAMGAMTVGAAAPDDVMTVLEAMGASDWVVLVDAMWAEACTAAIARSRGSLILAAPDERGTLSAHLANGFNGWIVKPCRPSSTAEQIGRVWRGDDAAAEEEGPSPMRSESDTASDHSPSVAAAPVSGGPLVLLVEDNPVNQMIARIQLERCGCEVDCVETGAAALEAAAQRAFDLILMDMRLPGMDGMEATRRLRASDGLSARAPVAALTANASEDDRQTCLAAGMDDFLTKPVSEDDFAALLTRWTSDEGRRNVAG